MVIEGEGIKCPHCRIVHKEYAILGAAYSPICQKCNKRVRKDLVPEQYIKYLPSKRRDKKEIKPKEEKEMKPKEKEIKTKEEKEEELKRKEEELKRKEEELIEREKEMRRKKKAPPFRSPKTSHKILEEILREFGCSDKFVGWMVNRSIRMGGIHPEELKRKIRTMESGIKSKGQASHIAEEYKFALDEKKKRAEELELESFYPLKEEEYGRRSGRLLGLRGEIRYPEERHVLDRLMREREGGVSRDEVRNIVEKVLDRMEERREREEILRNMGERINKMESAMASVPHQISDSVSGIIERSKERERPREEITKADLKRMEEGTKSDLERMAVNLERKYIEKDFEKSMKESKERERDFQKAVEGLSKERNELLRRLSTQKERGFAGYQSDSGRVIGEAVSGLKDVIETRQPMKLVVEGLPKLVYPEKFPGKLESERPKLKEEKIIGGGVSKFLDKEYLEEEE